MTLSLLLVKASNKYVFQGLTPEITELCFLRKTQFLGYTMESIIKRTLSLTFKFKYLLILFILIDVFLKLPHLIPKQLLSGYNIAYGYTVVSLFIIFLEPFVYAGYYGLVFLKIHYYH